LETLTTVESPALPVEATHAGSSSASVAWERLPFVGVVVLAAFVYVYNLTVSGFANTYYAMAAQAAAQSWSAWFWGSLDSSNFITVDKPPLATMLMGLSVRLFGLSSWSILLPEALCGIATIAVLYVTVRRYAGPVAATIAALVATLTPAAALIFRYNNPDALLTLLLVLAAWAFMRALEDGRLRWVVLSALFVGLAFNTKFLQAYLVLPAFIVVYAAAGPGSIRKRVIGLSVAAAVVLISSAWWVLAVQLTPADARPFIGGSTDGTALQLLFGYDGLGRIFGGIFGIRPGGPAGFGGPGGNPGVGFGGPPGLLRMFNPEIGGQIGWLLPFAAIAAISSLVIRRGKPRTDLGRAAVLMWAIWLAVHAIVFSFMGGIIHSYYTVVMAPATGALVGIGAVDLWRERRTHNALASLALASAIAVSAVAAYFLLERSPTFLPGVSVAIVAVGIAAAIAIVVAGHPRLALAAAVAGIAVVLVGPAAYSAQTMATAYSGGDPQAGPPAERAFVNGFPGFPGSPTATGDDDRQPRPPVGFTQRGAGALSQSALDYLATNRGSARWIVAAQSSNEAAPIQLVTGQPVMAMGGFNGSDPAPTLDQLKSYIAGGQLRFVLTGSQDFAGFGPALGFGATAAIDRWVRQSCAPVALPDGPVDGLYDCAGVG
jgi:4-amino-4-deoxy-L-arabinose transferase-like glycosyltransferase